jgi:(p)ppGpp synthase/HD superfamily hydrolase
VTLRVIKSAFDWAAVWHQGQHRKYPGVQVPYMSHVAGVAAILSRHGFDDEVVAAGALHDVIEDCKIGHAGSPRGSAPGSPISCAT